MKKEKRPQGPVSRIEYMEELFDRGLELIKDANVNPLAFLDFQSEIEKLEQYYGDERWKNDFALDEQGKLPADLKRGVLSEDGLYNLLEENKEVLKEVKEKYKDDPEVSAKIRFLGYEGFKKDILRNHWKVFGVEIYEDGELAYSFGDTKENIYPIYSCTKSILSIAAGIAWDRNLIDFEKSALYYIPQKYKENLSKEQTEKYEKLSLHRLMTMSVPGFPFRPWGDDYLKCCLEYPDFNPDEVSFEYSNMPVHVFGVSLNEAIGEDLGVFIESNLLKPLEITGAKYERTPEGFFYGASGMEMSVNDLSKFGLLLYNKGIYNGKQIVSEEYLNKATSILQMNREGGYGYYIWKYREGISMNGKFKQKCYILPERKLVITYLADIEDGSNVLRESMEKHVLGL